MKDSVYYGSYSAAQKKRQGMPNLGMKTYHSAGAQHHQKMYSTSRSGGCNCGKKRTSK